jgi:transposase
MGEVNTIGLDIVKSVFQVHGVDADGTVVIRKRVGRAKVLEFFGDLPPCVVGMEACATAHQWARELKMLGHDTRLMPPSYVKAYVKRGKNDAADAAAICEAVTRPSMRFVPIKRVGQQSALMLHRTRDLLIRQRTQLINALRAHLAELGLVAAKGREGLQQLITAVTKSSDERLPTDARFACQTIVAELHALQIQIGGLDKRINQTHRANADSKRLDAIPGFGVILSTAVVATMTDPKAFKTGREFAAWIGLVPRQNSTGGKERLGSISKQGDRYLRRLLVVGAISIVRTARMWPDKYPWVIELLGRRPAKVVAVALANKMARIAWAVLAKGENYRARTIAQATQPSRWRLEGFGIEVVWEAASRRTRKSRVIMV